MTMYQPIKGKDMFAQGSKFNTYTTIHYSAHYVDIIG